MFDFSILNGFLKFKWMKKMAVVEGDESRVLIDYKESK